MRLKKLLGSHYFWYAAVPALLASILSYTPQFTTLIQFSMTDWQVALYLAGYRLFFLVSVAIAAWRFGVKGGLVVCVVIGVIILSSLLVNSHLTNPGIDIGTIAIGVLSSWMVGKQGEMKRRLEITTAELKQQSMMLKSEIAERKQTEEKYRLIAEYSADIIYKLNINEEKFNYVSPSVERLLEYTEKETLTIKLKEILTPESYKKQRDELQEDIQNGKLSNTLQIDVIHKDGRIIPFEVHASLVLDDKQAPVEIVGVARDITERKKMEEQIIMQDRLASIGQLTSSLAHELNNPLTSIISFSHLLLGKKFAEETKQDLKIIYDEAQRIASTVKNLLTFTRKQSQEKRLMSVNECIQKVLEMRAYEQKVNNIQVNAQLDPDLPKIMGNSAQLQQVFFNIVINAEFFMLEANKKGALSIKTEKAGNSVRVFFTDNGPGISDENIRRIFLPFFTTKEVGKGTGLSLSICQGIITEHGGRILVESEPGNGAIFVIELPVNKKN